MPGRRRVDQDVARNLNPLRRGTASATGFPQQAPSFRTVLPGDAIEQFSLLRLGHHSRIGRSEALNRGEMICLGDGRHGPQQQKDAN